MTGAKDAVTTKVNDAKDTVSHTLIGVVDKTRGAVQDSVEMTKTVVNEGVNSVMGSRVAQLVSTGVDTALSTSENLVEQYLPLTKEELGESLEHCGLLLQNSIAFRKQVNPLFLIMENPGSESKSPVFSSNHFHLLIRTIVLPGGRNNLMVEFMDGRNALLSSYFLTPGLSTTFSVSIHKSGFWVLFNMKQQVRFLLLMGLTGNEHVCSGGPFMSIGCFKVMLCK